MQQFGFAIAFHWPEFSSCYWVFWVLGFRSLFMGMGNGYWNVIWNGISAKALLKQGLSLDSSISR